MKKSSEPLPLSEFIATAVSLVTTVFATLLSAYGYFRLIPPDRPDLLIQVFIILLLLCTLLLGNLVFYSYGLTAFIPWKEALEDLRFGVEKRVRRYGNTRVSK